MGIECGLVATSLSADWIGIEIPLQERIGDVGCCDRESLV